MTHEPDQSPVVTDPDASWADAVDGVAVTLTGPQYGSAAAGDALHSDAFGAIYACRNDDPSDPRIIKVIEPRRGFIDGKVLADRLSAFVGRAELMQRMSEAGAQNWVRVHESGQTATGAFVVLDRYPWSLRRVFEQDVRLPPLRLHAVIEGIVAGIGELRDITGRCHGNLSSGNVLLGDPAGREMAVRLTDPAAVATIDTEAADLRAIGELLYELVTQKPAGRDFVGPIETSDDWTRLGSAGEGWRSVCDQLLFPSGPQLDLDGLTGLVHELGPTGRKGRGGRGTKSGNTPPPGTIPGTSPLTAPVTAHEPDEPEDAAPERGGVRKTLTLVAACIAVAGLAAGAAIFLQQKKPPTTPLVSTPTTQTSQDQTPDGTKQPIVLQPPEPRPPVHTPREQADGLIDEAVKLRSTNLAAAFAKVREALAVLPDHTSANSMLHELMIEQQRRDGIRQSSELVDLARSDIAHGRYAEALAALERAAALPGNQQEVDRVRRLATDGRDVRLAEQTFDRGEIELALQQVNIVLARAPSQESGQALKARIEKLRADRLRGELDRRVADANSLLQQGGLRDARLVAIDVLKKDARHAGAEQVRQAVEAQLKAWLASAKAMESKGDFTAAIKVYDQVLQVESDRAGVAALRKSATDQLSAAGLVKEASGLFELDKLDESAAKVDAADKLVSGHLGAANLRRLIGARRQLLSDVAALVAEAAEKEQAGRWGDALATYDKALTRDRNSKSAAAGKAALTGRIEKALAEVKTKEDAGDLPAALGLVNDLLAKDPSNAVAAPIQARLARQVQAAMEKVRQAIAQRIRTADMYLDDWRPSDALAALQGATDAESVAKAAAVRKLIDQAPAELAAGDAVRDRDITAAVAAYKRAARGGHVGAMTRLGAIHRDGAGAAFPANRDDAVTAFNRAAGLNDVASMLAVAELLNGVNDRAAVEWQQRAALTGNAIAMLRLAERYEQGNRGVDKSDQLALGWYKRAAVEGKDATAMTRLARMYETGRGAAANAAEARKWYESAAAAGNPDAARWIKANPPPPPPVDMPRTPKPLDPIPL